MRYFWDFMEFVTMQELGKPDSIVRNYAIDHDYAGNRIIPTLESTYVGLGFGTIGFHIRDYSNYMALREIMSILNSRGWDVSDIIILGYVSQFYNYHRIKKGELKKWPMRRTLMS